MKSFPVRIILIAAALLCAAAAPSAVGAPPASPAKPKTADTFGELLERFGVESPEQRKYIEDTVKQELQEEINEHIDLKLDVEVYLKSLNHLANGEIKQANAYLTEEVGKKVLEWVVGGTAAKILTLAWDFDKYVWTSVQAWAEKRDRQRFRDWLKGRVHAWRNGRDLHEMQTPLGSRTQFDIWWRDNKNSFGRTKMYGDRQQYYDKFETACRHRYMDVARKCRQALQQRENLKLAMRSKLFEIRRKIAAQQGRYKAAVRFLRRAGLEGTPSQVRKYETDKAFAAKVAAEIKKQAPRTALELRKKVLTNADADLSRASDAAAAADKARKGGRAAAITPPLGGLQTFLAEERDILRMLFTNSVDPIEGVRALSRCRGLALSYAAKLGSVRDDLRRMRASGKAQRDSLLAQSRRIDTALRSFAKARKELTERYDRRAKDAVGTLAGPAARLEKIDDEAIHHDAYRSVPEALRVEAAEAPAIEAKAVLVASLAPGESRGPDGLTPAARYLAGIVQRGTYRTDPTPPTIGYINPQVPDPLERMDRADEWLGKAIDAYTACMNKHAKDLARARDADQGMLARYREALAAYASAWKPLAGAAAYARGGYSTLALDAWRHRYAAKETELNKALARVYRKWRRHYQVLARMHGFQEAMRVHFQQERSVLNRVQLLAAEAARLRKRYARVRRDGDTDPDAGAPDATDDVTGQAIGILRAGDRSKIFDAMIARYRAVLGMLDGTWAGYDRVLTPAMRASHGLARAPYEGWRRSPQLNRKILAEMERLIDRARAADDGDDRYADVLTRCDKIDKELDQVGGKARLLGGEVLACRQRARKDLAAVRVALARPEVIVRDADRATENMKRFRAFAARCAALCAADDRRVGALLARARSTVAGAGGGHDARAAAMTRAVGMIRLAERHAEVVAAFAPYHGIYRHNAALADARTKLKGGGRVDTPTDTPTEPTRFPREGFFAVSVNGAVFGRTAGGITQTVQSRAGELTVRGEAHDAAFNDPRKVMLRLTPLPARPSQAGPFVTVAEGRADFVHRTTIRRGTTYALEMRVVTRDGRGLTPAPSPLSFRWPGPGTQLAGDDQPGDTDRPNADDRPGAGKPSAATDTDDAPSAAANTSTAKQQAYQTYIAAYNKLTSLMAAGKGDTPEAKKAYKDYKAAKDAYEAAVKNPSSSRPSGGKPSAGTKPKAGPKAKPDKPDTDDAPAAKKRPTSLKAAYQTYIAAYNKLTSLMAAGKGDTPEAKKAYKDYKAAKDVYEAMAKDAPPPKTDED